VEVIAAPLTGDLMKTVRVGTLKEVEDGGAVDLREDGTRHGPYSKVASARTGVS